MDIVTKKRIIFVWIDASRIGGVPNRIRNLVSNSNHREFDYFAISRDNINNWQHKNHVCLSSVDALSRNFLSSCNRSNSVFVTSNEVVLHFKSSFQRHLQTFPIIHICAAPMAYFVQNTMVLANQNFVKTFRASKLVSLSASDTDFQQQLGITSQTKGFLPVKSKSLNSFSRKSNIHLGYVGRMHFATKNCLALLDIAEIAAKHGMPPLLIFTTTGTGSPDLDEFRARIRARKLEDAVELHLNKSDLTEIYSRISILLLPSVKESFGNVVLEAFSFGIPVVALKQATGPAELIADKKTGFLLESFSADAVIELIRNLSPSKHSKMSADAFETHKAFSMERFFDLIENLATDSINTFTGRNEIQVFPELKLARIYPTALYARLMYKKFRTKHSLKNWLNLLLQK